MSFMRWTISVILSVLNSVDILPTCGAANQTQTESHPSRICWQTSFCACLSGSLPSSFASETSSSSVCVPVLLQRINITQWPSNPFAVSPLYIKHERDTANMQLLLNPSEAQMINQSKFILCIKKWDKNLWAQSSCDISLSPQYNNLNTLSQHKTAFTCHFNSLILKIQIKCSTKNGCRLCFIH